MGEEGGKEGEGERTEGGGMAGLRGEKEGREDGEDG
jgi:hypothetical protein